MRYADGSTRTLMNATEWSEHLAALAARQRRDDKIVAANIARYRASLKA